MRTSALLLIFAAGVASAQKQSVSGGRIAGQIAAAAVGAPVGFAVGYTIGSGLRPHGESNTGVALGLAGALLGPAAGVNLVGTGTPSHGNFGAAVGGAALGYGAAYLAFPLARKVTSIGHLKKAATIDALFLPAVGATVAYNSTRK